MKILSKNLKSDPLGKNLLNDVIRRTNQLLKRKDSMVLYEIKKIEKDIKNLRKNLHLS